MTITNDQALNVGQAVRRTDTDRTAQIIAIRPMRAVAQVQYENGSEDTLSLALLMPVQKTA